jgi:hypothetical protein
MVNPNLVTGSVDPSTGKIRIDPGSFVPSSDWGIWFQQLFQSTTGSAGIIVADQNAFPALTPANAKSFIFVKAPYYHLIFWDGVTPEFADGGSNYYTIADANPATGLQTAGGGWVPMAGQTSVSYLNADGTISTRSLVNLIGTPAYLKVGTGASALSAAVAPTLTMNPLTPAGTNSAPALTMNSYTPQGTNSAPALTMNSYTPQGTVSVDTSGLSNTPSGTVTSSFVGNASTSTNVLNTAGVTAVVPAPFTPTGAVTSAFAGAPSGLSGTATASFTGTPAILTGTVAAPAFTGTAHVLTGVVAAPVFSGTPVTPTGTVGANGTPETMYSRLWMRI